ncbi:MAG TPA: hypothetical protein DCP97_03730 [Ruminococcaceae bacterium]|nr:hypothetical protein [Oscillospiraceae bacterium]
MSSIKNKLEHYAELIEQSLNKYLSQAEIPQKNVIDAMRYSLLNGGKRIRAVLTLEFCRICKGSIDDALPFACAVEMIHAYSLIHDDLPCMDNDDMRRGKPSCHKAFGEAIALLAGDGLLTFAFETICKFGNVDKIGASNIIKIVSVLSSSAGIYGMIGGQVVDIENEGKDVSHALLDYMYANKTGALIRASAVIGCLAANADDYKIGAADKYAQNIGLAFQIIDDILDVAGNEKLLGKPVGSDIENNKTTYATLFGIEKSKQIAAKLNEQAKDAVSIFNDDNSFLCELADYLIERQF